MWFVPVRFHDFKTNSRQSDDMKHWLNARKSRDPDRNVDGAEQLDTMDDIDELRCRFDVLTTFLRF